MTHRGPSHAGRAALAARAALLAALAAAPLAAPAGAQVASHPDALVYPDLAFEPPMSAEYRHELSNGVAVYLAPTDEFPLVDVTFTFKGGQYLEDGRLVGLGASLGQMMRLGGTTEMAPDALDDRLDFLAANVGVSVGTHTSTASLDTLKSNFDESFELFMDVVRRPGFDAERLRIHKDQRLEGFKLRNDAPQAVAFPRMSRLMYGDDHYRAREPTVGSLERIDASSLGALHARIFHPGNLVVAATGDFEVPWMLERLEAAMEGWPAGEVAPDPPAPTHVMRPGLYHADTTQSDLPQGTALLFQRSVTRDHPDAIALSIMNDILGGGGFTSRVTNRVRSDEGLAYSAGTFLQPEVWYDGLFAGFFQSKNRTVALAAKIVVEEIERIRTEPVSDFELERAKNGFIEQFPSRFASKSRMLGTFVDDEMTGREPGYWQAYRDRVRSVTAEDVQRVASEHLRPDALGILIVGDWEAIEGGDLEGRADMGDFHDGDVEHLPMLDPLTREPMDDSAVEP